MANFTNDVAHEDKLQNSVIEQDATGIDTSRRSPDALLRDLDKAYQSTIALAACRFQDDPHNQKITISTFE